MNNHSIMTKQTLRTAGIFLSLCAFFFATAASAQTTYSPPATTRRQTPLAGPWKFIGLPHDVGQERPGYDDSGWQTVQVPHTWNDKTNMVVHHYAWYRCRFPLAAGDKGQEIFLSFEGAATVADVYLNGVFLGQHRGAYTRFLFDATRCAMFGRDNVLAVRVDNSPEDTADCLPSGTANQLYHVYGGLYRKVWLLRTAPVHVDPTDHAASGLFITPSHVSADGADVSLRTLVRNDGLSPENVTVQNTITDPDGHVVATAQGTATVGPQSGGTVLLTAQVTHPRLWGPAAPALYHVYAETQVNGQTTDLVAERTGFRFFRMTPGTFFLNGAATQVHGVAKHQENEDRASAITDDDLVRDYDQLQALGVNYVRLAHYPHSQREYDLADERGIMVWAENGHSNAGPPTETGEEITREMVRQNYNHPSILFWSAGNEAIQRPSDIATIEDYAAVIRQEDTSRLVTYASNTLFTKDSYLDFVAVNRYSGWYGGRTWDFNLDAAKYHAISETGAGGVITTHGPYQIATATVNLYEPEEYQQYVVEARCQAVFRDLADQVSLFTWWTFRDFADPRYKGFNTKGLETDAGFPKDTYYLFQSFQRPQTPVVHLCGKTWFLRRSASGLEIKAYSNAPTLTLSLNGRVISTRRNGLYRQRDLHTVENVFLWTVTAPPGKYQVKVEDGQGHTDSALLSLEGPHGEQGDVDPAEWVQGLSSSNPLNPARYIDEPIQAEWPFYDDFDGTGDNTFHTLPDILAGAHWITTRRVSRSTNVTELDFQIAPDAKAMDIFVLFSATALPPPFLTDAGFADTGVTGKWRNNQTNLVPFALYKKTVAAGDRVHLGSALLDYVILVKPHGERETQR